MQLWTHTYPEISIVILCAGIRRDAQSSLGPRIRCRGNSLDAEVQFPSQDYKIVVLREDTRRSCLRLMKRRSRPLRCLTRCNAGRALSIPGSPKRDAARRFCTKDSFSGAMQF